MLAEVPLSGTLREPAAPLRKAPPPPLDDALGAPAVDALPPPKPVMRDWLGVEEELEEAAGALTPEAAELPKP